MMTKMEVRAHDLLRHAHIVIDGARPFDIQIPDEYRVEVFRRVFAEGDLGLGETYVEGKWDVKAEEGLAELFCRLSHPDLRGELQGIAKFQLAITFVQARLMNLQSQARARRVGFVHYDKGNTLFERMLGPSMAYSGGYWPRANNLDDAQWAKYDLICRKLCFKEGDHVLDIGCGWGGFLKYAAERYSVRGTGVTVSQEQAKYAVDWCGSLPVDILLQDWRQIGGKYDHVVSIGMFEHVGPPNYRAFMEKVCSLVKNDGLILLHTIGSRRSRRRPYPWLDKYIFPGGVLPSVAQIGRAIDSRLVMEDWHNFGHDYEKTLLAWYHNFCAAWPELQKECGYDETFRRMWVYYLLMCAGLFRARRTQLWQVVLSKYGVPGGYTSVR